MQNLPKGGFGIGIYKILLTDKVMSVLDVYPRYGFSALLREVCRRRRMAFSLI